MSLNNVKCKYVTTYFGFIKKVIEQLTVSSESHGKRHWAHDDPNNSKCL